MYYILYVYAIVWLFPQAKIIDRLQHYIHVHEHYSPLLPVAWCPEQVFDRLTIVNPDLCDGQLLITPDTEMRLKTNR